MGGVFGYALAMRQEFHWERVEYILDILVLMFDMEERHLKTVGYK